MNTLTKPIKTAPNKSFWFVRDCFFLIIKITPVMALFQRLKKEPNKNSQQTEKQLKQVRQDISNRTQSELKEFSKDAPTLASPEITDKPQLGR